MPSALNVLRTRRPPMVLLHVGGEGSRVNEEVKSSHWAPFSKYHKGFQIHQIYSLQTPKS